MLSSYILTFLLMNSDLLSQTSAQVPSEHRPDRGLCGAAECGRLPHQAQKIGDIHGLYRSGKHTKLLAIEHGPVEIVDLPIKYH